MTIDFELTVGTARHPVRVAITPAKGPLVRFTLTRCDARALADILIKAANNFMTAEESRGEPCD